MSLISIIIPTLNESESIEKTLNSLHTTLKEGNELIIVDGGSNDDTISKCKNYTDKIYTATKGRAIQMNAGVDKATNDILLFLHADTLMPQNFSTENLAALDTKTNEWGFFKVKFTSRHLLLRLVSRLMNIRSCLTRIATGDQAIFIKKELFEKIGGYKEIPLMEDIELSLSVKKHSKPYCVKTFVTTSSRKWESNGIIKTILLMWKIRFLYFFGVSPQKLVNIYYK